MANSNHCYVPSAAQKCNLYWPLPSTITKRRWQKQRCCSIRSDSNYSGCIRCRHRCCAGTADQQQLATACLVQSETHRSRTEMQRFDRDLLALYLPIRHIWCYIEDRHFIAFADHT
ncbi:hypothetical protein T03_11711 [Trichinella britovi]|uniref:Reverse transcriptase RNase H-like domain-containing protein n=1 Tax=Trichinella britovi TaxID=45882 RepID=A0A0V1C6C1_TRIBR|nr:hypothetical protein T03_11711 [Trichinella britovi]